MEAIIQLEKAMVDLGYPDPGHEEYYLVRRKKRTSQFWQTLFGDKTEKLIGYGETKPSDESVARDILHYSKIN